MRYVLGGIAGALAIVFVAFFIFADSFRRSFGASPNAPWKLVVPLAVMILVAAATLLSPNRVLLHLAAVAILATAIGCVMILRQGPFISSLGLLYCACWLWYFWNNR